MRYLNKLFKRDKLNRYSDILILEGNSFQLRSEYEMLCHNKDIHITSVSIGKNHTSYEHPNEVIMAISYDYYK